MVRFFNLVVIPIGIVAIISFLYFYWSAANAGSTMANIQHIYNQTVGAKGIPDMKDEIGVKSVKDIKLMIDKDSIIIAYGKIRLDWRKDDFLKPETKEALESIGITYYVDKNNKLHVYYYEEEVERWVF